MKKSDKLKELHNKNKLTEIEKKNILRIWSEGSVKYGNILCFLISLNGEKYIKKGFFYNYILLKKSWVDTMKTIGYWSSIEKYVIWEENEPDVDQEVIDQYEQETGLTYPEVEPMVRIYYNTNTCDIKFKNGLQIPTSSLNSDNFRRPSTSKNLENLLEQYETEKTELNSIPDNQKKNWFDANPWRVKCDPELYVMEGYSKGKRYLQKALDKIGCLTYEANITQEERLMVNHHNEYQYKQDLSILFWDIETDDRVKKKIVAGEFNIVSISYADFNEFQKLGSKSIRHIRLDEFESEKEMLEYFCEVLEKYDICSGWNSGFFDLSYLKKRNDLNNIFFDWRRIYHIDLMKIYQEFYKSEKGDESMSFGLDSMGKVILGMEKIQHAEDIYEMYEKNPLKLKKYNDRDVEILCSLEKKNGFLRNYLAICSTSYVDYEHTGNYNKVKRDALVMAHKHKYFRYSDKSYDQKEQDRVRGKATGAFVAHPKPGMVSNVIAVDIGSLYPSTIMQFNICNSTFVAPEDQFEHEEYCTTANKAKFRRDRIGYLPRMFDIIKQKRNYYKKIQKDLKDKGLINSNEFAVAESLEYAWKAKGLSIYGCLGLKSSILFNFDMVEAVTLTGQYFLTEGVRYLFGNSEHRRITEKGDVFCARFQKNEGIEKEHGPFSNIADFRYMDTDSYYIEIKNYLDNNKLKSLSDVVVKSQEWTDIMMNTGQSIMDSVHQKYSELGIEMNSIVDKIFLDFEQVYSKMVFTSVKKRYCGDLAWHKGNLLKGYNIKHKGFELIKRDGIPFMKLKQEELLDWMLRQDVNIDDIQEWVIKLRQYILGENDSKPKFDELAESKRVTKSPEEYKNQSLPLHVRMMIKQQKEGDQINVGQSVRYVATRGESRGDYQSEGISERQFNRLTKKYGEPPYDKVHYWNRIFNPLSSILESVFSEVPWKMFTVERGAKEIYGKGLSENSEDYLKAHKQAVNLFSI